MNLPKPEKTDWNGKCTNARWRQTLFRLKIPVLVELRFEVVVQVVEERYQDDKSANEDTQECQSLLAKVEAINFAKDDNEGLEPDVKEAVNQSDVEVEQEDHGFYLMSVYSHVVSWKASTDL